MYTNKNAVPVNIHTLKTDYLTLSIKKNCYQSESVPTIMSNTVYIFLLNIKLQINKEYDLKIKYKIFKFFQIFIFPK